MNIGIAFASLSGNTLSVAIHLQTFLQQQGHEATLHDLLETQADQLKKHSLVFLGSSTYGDGDLNPIAEMFFISAKQENHDCHQTKFALIALGDSSYPQFAAGGKLVSDNLLKMHAHLLQPVFTVDGEPDEQVFTALQDWASTIIRSVENLPSVEK